MGMGMLDLGDLFGKSMGGRVVKKRMTVAQSHDVLLAEEADKLIDDETIKQAALESVEQSGIVFLDEIDKVAARQDARGGDVSREGVQRDLLPLTAFGRRDPAKRAVIRFHNGGNRNQKLVLIFSHCYFHFRTHPRSQTFLRRQCNVCVIAHLVCSPPAGWLRDGDDF